MCFDKNTESAEYKDIVISTDNIATGLKNGTANVNTDNYTIAENTLTIKKEYLQGLAEGVKKFTILESAGSYSVEVKIIDTTE